MQYTWYKKFNLPAINKCNIPGINKYKLPGINKCNLPGINTIRKTIPRPAFSSIFYWSQKNCCHKNREGDSFSDEFVVGLIF